MGDFRKAFPSVIRQDLLHSLADGPGICGDSLLLLNSILQKDVVSIWFSGFSVITDTTGIPEGGTLGPFAYPCLLDSLVRELLAAECGVGLQINIPNAWASMQWRGQGSPCQETVNLLKAAIQRNTPLPHVSLLVADSTLEASALKALSDLAPHRLAAILHADDPVLLGSCRGELQRSLHIVANWAHRHGAAFHVGDNKTISMICGQQAVPPLPPSDTQLYLPGRGSGVDCTLHTKAEHKWLGITWTKSLSFHKSLCQKATLASAIWVSICALLRSKALPMDLAMSLFRTKVLPTLRTSLKNFFRIFRTRGPDRFSIWTRGGTQLVNLVARSSFSWEVRVAVFALCKIRAGALTLSSLNGRRSSAKIPTMHLLQHPHQCSKDPRDGFLQLLVHQKRSGKRAFGVVGQLASCRPLQSNLLLQPTVPSVPSRCHLGSRSGQRMHRILG